MSHDHIIAKVHQESSVEWTIRFSLRAMGVFALTTCIVFWLSLLLQ